MGLDVERVIDIACRIGGLAPMAADRDIYDAGLASVDALEFLLELESEFAVTIPDEDFMAARTPEALAALIVRLRAAAA